MSTQLREQQVLIDLLTKERDDSEARARAAEHRAATAEARVKELERLDRSAAREAGEK